MLQRQQRQEGGTWCRLMSMRVNPDHSDEKKHSKSTVMGSRLSGLNDHPRHPVHGRQRNASKLRWRAEQPLITWASIALPAVWAQRAVPDQVFLLLA